MARIRPFVRNDLPAVTELMRARFPGWPHDESFLAATLLDHPWADPDLPSFVGVDRRGEVIGFAGVQVRRMKLGDRTLRAVCGSHLVVSADHRDGIRGADFVRHVLSGPQDLTFTDSATERVVHLWRSLGGYMNYERCHDWMLVLRPVRWLGAILAAGARRRVIASGLVPVGALPIQAAGPRLLGLAHPAPAVDVHSEDATTASIVAHLPTLNEDVPLRVHYDHEYLDYLFTLVESCAGPLVRRIVRREGRPIGCYVYVRRPGGLGRVVYLSALETETDAVFGELVERARADGTTVLAGRDEPRLHESLRRRLAVFGSAGRLLVHARDPEVISLLATESSLLTHFDGEWFTTLVGDRRLAKPASPFAAGLRHMPPSNGRSERKSEVPDQLRSAARGDRVRSRRPSRRSPARSRAESGNGVARPRTR